MYALSPSHHFAHSIGFSGSVGHRSAEASGREDLQIKEPIVGRDSSAFHCHATLTGMLSPTLRGHQVVEVGQPREKRLLTATGMMEAFQREQFPLDGVVGLIQQGTGHWHLGVCEHHLPAGL
jgi:hypothetical protein